MPTPVYLFAGFLDSGKTSLIQDTLSDPQFMENIERTLILRFEEGETDYDEKWLLDHHAFLETFDDIDDLSTSRMEELDTIYHPSQVFIEYNGCVPISEAFIQRMPEYWPLVEILSTVDATTFENFITNMRGVLYEQLRYSDVIIVNRCTENTSVRMLRGNIKAINPKAQIFYEGEHGAPVEMKESLLPFDLNEDVLRISDDDYGLWYMDCSENPDKYDGKTVILRGAYAEKLEGYHQSFILGRRAMVCCAADTSLCGVTVTGVKIEEMNFEDWYEVEGVLKSMELESGAKTVILHAKRIQHVLDIPKDPYVYFS